MNSLEFIKQHVTEWPNTYDRSMLTHCALLSNGTVVYGNQIDYGKIEPYAHDDLSEHFAPDYYDGKVWTREEFESVGDVGGLPSWDIAPEWATSLGTVGISNNLIWYDDKSYMYVEWPSADRSFDVGNNRKFHDVKHIMSRAHPVTPAQSFDNVTNNKYEREITDRQGNSATVDVYDVIIAFGVTCPATQHAIKKLLCTGERGHKDTSTDLSEARDSITRAIELLR